MVAHPLSPVPLETDGSLVQNPRAPHPIIGVQLHFEQDVVLARQRAKQIAELLGFDGQDQVRIATAVSELARNAFQYATGGKVEFLAGESTLAVVIRDRGPGIADVDAVLEGRARSQSGMGIGIAGSRRLMDEFQIRTTPRGTTISIEKTLPRRNPVPVAQRLARISADLARPLTRNPLDDIQSQNQEVLRLLDELRQRQAELQQVNAELEETNRGVVALYSELEEKAEAVRRAADLKSRFMSYMSHEFRTPVNSIINLSGFLLDRLDGDLTPEQHKQAALIRRAADALLEMVNDLLDLAKAEAGKLDVRLGTFDVRDLFAALRGVLRPLFTQDGVALIFDDPPDLGALTTDEGKLNQILRNFVSNALKFTEHGEVRVSAEAGPDDTLVFRVSDTGIGIAPQDFEWIFEEFTQVEGAAQRRVKGTGLGLPLTRKLAELLGGKVTLQSELGRGSTFSVMLPRTYSPQPSSPATGRESPAAAAALLHESSIAPPAGLSSVLIIDDDDAARYALRRILSAWPCQIREATQGEEGLRQAREQRPDLILLDWIMPVMDGMETLGQLRADAALRDIPVVFWSSRSLTPQERQVIAEQVVAILPKDLHSGTRFLQQLGDALR